MWTASIVLSAALAALAWQIARVRPRHRAVASLITVGLVADVARRVFALLVFEPTRAAIGRAPFTGATRALFHIDAALFLAWPFGLAALAAFVFLERPRRALAAALALYGVATVSLALGYPTLRGASLASVYTGVQLAALVVVAGTGASWVHRRERPDLTVGSVMVLAAIDLGAVLAWRVPFTGWDFAFVLYGIAYVTLAILHVGELWRPRTLA